MLLFIGKAEDFGDGASSVKFIFIDGLLSIGLPDKANSACCFWNAWTSSIVIEDLEIFPKSLPLSASTITKSPMFKVGVTFESIQ